MSEQIAHRTGSTIDLRPALPWIVAAAVCALLAAVGPKLLNDPDTYSHIALGRWIIAHGAVPTTDPFSLTMRGEHWVAFEWLSQIVYAIAFDAAGWPAVVALASLTTGLSFALLARFLMREWQPTPVLVALMGALVLLAPHVLARPHVLALPILVAWIAALIRARDVDGQPPWRILPLMILWANLHGSFTFGLAMIGPVALEALIAAPAQSRWRVVRQWALFGVLALAAACLNPYGPEMIVVTFRTVALGSALLTITEWRPPDFSHVGPYEMIVVGGIAAALYYGVRLPWLRLVMLLGVLHLSLSQARHADLLGMLAPIFIARPLAMQFTALARRTGSEVHASVWGASLAGAILVAALGLTMLRHDLAPPAHNTPAAALRAIDAAKAGPIFNDYDFGAYLDFVGVPAFIDGRTELYGAAFTLRYDRAVKLTNLPDFLALLDENHIRTTLLAPETPAVALLDRLPGWKRVYADDVAVVHQRTGG
ncbi:MAG: hypothetical protein ACTHLO_02770 [Pseudolabrys sp.]